MFGSRLKELREAKGMSQKQLAESSGLSQNGISQWENGDRMPSWDAVIALCEALQVECTAFRVRGDATKAKPVDEPKAKPAKKPAAKRKPKGE